MEEVVIVVVVEEEVEDVVEDEIHLRMKIKRRSHSINPQFSVTIVKSIDTLHMSVEVPRRSEKNAHMWQKPHR